MYGNLLEQREFNLSVYDTSDRKKKDISVVVICEDEIDGHFDALIIASKNQNYINITEKNNRLLGYH